MFLSETFSIQKFGYNSSRSNSCYYVFILFVFRAMTVEKAFDVAMSTTKLSLWTTTTSVFYFMSRVNNVWLFVINYLS